jgi:hypothetical protein
VSIGRLFLVPWLALGACQDPPRQTSAPEPAAIQVRDGSGASIAELRPSRPCRATIAGAELIVGGPPLIATYGETKWTGTTDTNGTTLSKDGARVARVFPVGDPAQAAVLDMQGVALARIAVTGDKATVSDAASVPVRNFVKAGDAIKSDSPALTITGTNDLILAALLASPELQPEVRMLAACERVLVKGS